MSLPWRPPAAAGQAVTGSVVFGDIIQVSQVDGDVTISNDRPPYRVTTATVTRLPLRSAWARAQPSRLLLARHQVVPFTGRERTLTDLAAWVSDDEAMGIRLIHAPGGQGKTRLAAEVAERCTAAGWTVWQVTHTPTPVVGSRMDLPGPAVLAVVDYADRWPLSALLALLAQLHALNLRTATVVRVLLLARSTGYWWSALADRVDADFAVAACAVALPTLAGDGDRRGLFTAAADRFAVALGVEHAGWQPPPALDGSGFAQVLAVHMAALVAVDAYRHGDDPPAQPHGISAYLLRREYAYWQHLHARTEDPLRTRPAVLHRAAYIATLIGALPRPAARQALIRTQLAVDIPTADQIIDDHRVCHPPANPNTVLEGLHPDRLGEDLIALSTPGHDHHDIAGPVDDWTLTAPSTLLADSGGQPPAWTPAAITVLVETARRWPHVATGTLYPLIRQHPELALTAGAATLLRLADLPTIDVAVLEALEPLLPDRHIDLDIAAVAITAVLTPRRLAATTDPAEHARLQATHAWRLTNAGQHQQALEAAEEVVTIRRRLADTDPAAHLPSLASSLMNLGVRLSNLGRRQEALALTEEATTIHRSLADTNPATHLPDLAASLNNLGQHLSELGRIHDALPPTEEATRIRRQLAETNPATHLPDLAASLNNLGIRRSELGHAHDALPPTEEATTIYRQLADTNPATHLPGLAMSLMNLGVRLSNLGRRQEALAPTEEATTIYRQLADANPATHLPDLAASLNNLGLHLSESGRTQDALPPTEEATTIYRRLAHANPAAHLPGLAMSLMNLGVRLRHLRRWQDALVATEEATTIYRQLADTHRPDLAGSLTNLGVCLADLGRPPDALAASEEATTIYRQLANTNPAAHLPSLAGSLRNLGNRLARLGRPQEALPATEEATAIYRQLANTNPAAHLPSLAGSLTNLGNRLAETGRRQEALAATEEATTIYRRLADTDPAAFLPDLAQSLLAHATACVKVQGDLSEVLPTLVESVNLYLPLAEQQPQVFSGQLFLAYRTLADVLARLGHTEEAATIRQLLDQTGEGTAE